MLLNFCRKEMPYDDMEMEMDNELTLECQTNQSLLIRLSPQINRLCEDKIWPNRCGNTWHVSRD